MLEVPFAFHFLKYLLLKKWSENFITVIKVKLLVSKVSKSCFRSLYFLSNALSFSQQVKISKKFTQFEIKLEIFTGRLNSKSSVAFISYGSCQQIRLIFSLRTQRFSIRLHMKDHKIPLSSFIISHFNSLTTVKYVFELSHHGHIMHSAVQCEQLNEFSKKNCLRVVWKAVKVFMHTSECRFFCSLYIPKWWQLIKKYFHKYFVLIYIIFQFFETNLKQSCL